MQPNICSVNLFEIAVLAVALAFDLSGMCLASGILLRKAGSAESIRFLFVLITIHVMLFFAGLMVGATLYTLIGRMGQWIALILFTGTGFKILFKSFQLNSGEKVFETFELKTMIIPALAASINPFIIASGIGFLSPDIPKSMLVMGVITFLFTTALFYVGKIKGSSSLKLRLGSFGGLILVAAGLHLYIKLI